MRAEHCAGELLRKMEKAKPAGSNQDDGSVATRYRSSNLSNLGVTKTQSGKWQKPGALDDCREAISQRFATSTPCGSSAARGGSSKTK
jgi:hypothetical protein